MFKKPSMSAWGTAFSISGYVLSLYFVVKAIKRFVFTHSFVGYWKYYSIAGADEDLSQAHQLPRLVELIEDHGKYIMSIYTPSKGKSVIWSSNAFPKRSSTVSRSAPS